MKEDADDIFMKLFSECSEEEQDGIISFLRGDREALEEFEERNPDQPQKPR